MSEIKNMKSADKGQGSVKFDMKEYERNMTGQFELN